MTVTIIVITGLAWARRAGTAGAVPAGRDGRRGPGGTR